MAGGVAAAAAALLVMSESQSSTACDRGRRVSTGGAPTRDGTAGGGSWDCDLAN